MPVTWTKLETFTGTRTQTEPAPAEGEEATEVTVDCRDIEVEFTDGTITHTRHVNVCYDADGEYDEDATDARIAEVAMGIENKIAVGVIS